MKTVSITKLNIILLCLFLASCQEKNLSKNQQEEKTQQITKADKAKIWIGNLFKCKGMDGFCFYVDDEPKVTTKRFYEFMLDSEQIFGATNFTEEEMPKAKKEYEEKWSQIYPLRTDAEPWLFGRGQDDMLNIQNVEIQKISDLKYWVNVNYDGTIKTKNKIILVKQGNTFKIDYCETEFLH